MKKSHRKDVILARIIFAVACVILIVLIVIAVMCVRKFAPQKADGSESQIRTESQEGMMPGTGDEQTPPESQVPDSQIVEPNPVMQTTTGVNLRAEPNTTCEVVTVLAEGTQLELLGEENGWAFVDYQGQTGYVSTDYLTEVTGESTP